MSTAALEVGAREMLPLWAQPGVTAVAPARAFLADLGAADTLTLPVPDGDEGYRSSLLARGARGLGATVAGAVLAAAAPAADLLAYHRELGVAPSRWLTPAALGRRPLAAAALADPALLRRLRAGGFRRLLLAFRDADGERLQAALGLGASWCAPSAQSYAVANDKLAFAAAAPAHGVPTLPMLPADDVAAACRAWRELAPHFGAGCVLRRPRSAGGNGFALARRERDVEGAWRLLRAPRVMVMPYVPPERVRREVAVHGLMTAHGFAPLFYSDQLLRGVRYRGARVAATWCAAELAALAAAQSAFGDWLRGLDFTEGAAGFDGFFVEDGGRERLFVLDPNGRLTGSTLPWAVEASLAEAAGRAFVWQVESFRLLGRAPSLGWLRRQLGEDLLEARRLAAGGILPSLVHLPVRVGAVAAWWLRAILLASDEAHLDHLRRRVTGLAPLVC